MALLPIPELRTRQDGRFFEDQLRVRRRAHKGFYRSHLRPLAPVSYATRANRLMSSPQMMPACRLASYPFREAAWELPRLEAAGAPGRRIEAFARQAPLPGCAVAPCRAALRPHRRSDSQGLGAASDAFLKGGLMRSAGPRRPAAWFGAEGG